MAEAEEHNLIWCESSEDPSGKPDFREVVFTGAFNDALDHILVLAKSAKFLLGNVLSKDGKVLATIAPQGNVHISRE